MKKLLLFLFLSLAILAGVLWFRMQTVFDDHQVQVTQQVPQLAIDQRGAVQRFSKAITFKTISYDAPGQLDSDAFNGLTEHIQNSFPFVHQRATQTVVSEHSLVYHFKGSDSSLKPALFMGHVDVVPVDDVTLSQWQHPPFSGAVVDGEVWGRGTIDDKVTVMALLESMELLLAKNAPIKRDIYFAFGHDEEIGGPNGAAKIAQWFRDQQVEFEFVLDEGGAITQGIMQGIEQPIATIGIAEKGFVNIKLEVRDEGGHSSQPPPNTAVGILSEAIVKLEDNQFDENLSFTYNTFRHVANYAPATARLPMANLWLFKPLVINTLLNSPTTASGIRSTIAPTMLSGSTKSNILPTLATGVVNVRIMPGQTVEDIKQHFVQAIDDSRVTISTFMENQPSAVSPTDSLGYQLIEKHIRQLDNEVLVAPYLVTGGTDAKHFYGLSQNIYRFMMVRLDKHSLKRFHGVNERLPVEDYFQAIAFYHNLLQETAGGEG